MSALPRRLVFVLLLGAVLLAFVPAGLAAVKSGDEHANTIRGTAAKDRIRGAGSRDVLRGLGGNDLLSGGSASDQLYGGDGADSLDGGSGNDKLVGEEGNDFLYGFTGNDRLDGGIGNDVLNGGVGRDTLIGGFGRDVFDFNSVTESRRGSAHDTVYFRRADGDKIDLAGIDADTDHTGGNQAFRFIGAHAFSGVDGQLRFDHGLLQGDTNGDRIADFEIRVIGALAGGDIIL